MKKDDFYIERNSSQSPAERAARHSRKRKIRTAAILISFVVVLVVVWLILYSQGPFDPRGLIKSRYSWLG